MILPALVVMRLLTVRCWDFKVMPSDPIFIQWLSIFVKI